MMRSWVLVEVIASHQEGWINWDALSLMQQLGVVPELGKAKSVAAAR
jgi:hypothetical protein